MPIQVLSDDGTTIIDNGASLPVLDQRRQMLCDMLEARRANQRLFALQRQGRIGTYAPIEGQEASVVGVAHGLDPGIDWIFPYYREQVGLRRFAISDENFPGN